MAWIPTSRYFLMLGVWRQIDIVDQRVVIIVRRSLGVAIAMNVPASVFFRGKTCCLFFFVSPTAAFNH